MFPLLVVSGACQHSRWWGMPCPLLAVCGCWQIMTSGSLDMWTVIIIIILGQVLILPARWEAGGILNRETMFSNERHSRPPPLRPASTASNDDNGQNNTVSSSATSPHSHWDEVSWRRPGISRVICEGVWGRRGTINTGHHWQVAVTVPSVWWDPSPWWPPGQLQPHNRLLLSTVSSNYKAVRLTW